MSSRHRAKHGAGRAGGQQGSAFLRFSRGLGGGGASYGYGRVSHCRARHAITVARSHAARVEALQQALGAVESLRAGGSSSPAVPYLAAPGALAVRPSLLPGAGDGLFFQGNDQGQGEGQGQGETFVEKGAIVTLYACHGLGYYLSDEQSALVSNGDDDEDCVLNLIGGRPLLGSLLTPVDFAGAALTIHVDPTAPRDDPRWLGQFINDGAVAAGSSEAQLCAYYEASRAAKNVVLVPFGPAPLVASVATRRIEAGEELLTSYGCEFWLERLAAEPPGSEGADVPPGITPQVLAHARGLAADILEGAKGCALSHRTEAAALNAAFGHASGSGGAASTPPPSGPAGSGPVAGFSTAKPKDGKSKNKRKKTTKKGGR